MLTKSLILIIKMSFEYYNRCAKSKTMVCIESSIGAKLENVKTRMDWERTVGRALKKYHTKEN